MVSFSSFLFPPFFLSLFAALWPVMSVAQQRASLYQSAVAQTLSALQRPSFISKLFTEEACKLLPHQPPWQKSKLPNAQTISEGLKRTLTLAFWFNVTDGMYLCIVYVINQLQWLRNIQKLKLKFTDTKLYMISCAYGFLNTFTDCDFYMLKYCMKVLGHLNCTMFLCDGHAVVGLMD